MKVILNAEVEGVGRKGEVVEVAAGYARNFLLPRNLALQASKGALRQAEQMQRAQSERDRKEREAAEELASRISSTTLRISGRAGEEGHLFGSVTTAEIAEELSRELGEEIDRRKVRLMEPIRSVGTHGFEVELGGEVVAEGTVEVVADSP